MRKRILSLALAASMALALAGCAGGTQELRAAQPPEPVEARADAALDTAAAAFGLELLRTSRAEGENTFLSPLSVLLCLSMAANGAEGETLAQFEAVLGGGGSLEALNANCASLLAEYAALGEESELSIADSLWLDGRVRVKDAFVGRCTDTYQAGVFSADFTGDATRREINKWIEEHTGGNIKNALSEIDPSTVLALVNAVYFQGKWENEFDPDDTREDRDFYLEDGTRGQVDLMSNGGGEEYYLEVNGGQGVLLPYRDGRTALLALLPPEGTTLTDYLAGLDAAGLQSGITEAEASYLTLHFPKFTAYWQESLLEILADMGLTDAFDPELADFSAMGTDENGNPLYISAAVHGAGVEVDEQGTRAFAFTFFGMNGAAAPPDTVLTFDRPFVYGIVDIERGIPLFLGTFERPE